LLQAISKVFGDVIISVAHNVCNDVLAAFAPLRITSTSTNAHFLLERPSTRNVVSLLQADVFSFGMMLYQLVQRYLTIFAVSSEGDPMQIMAYAARVAAGYRPPISKRVLPSVARLIQVGGCGTLPRSFIVSSYPPPIFSGYLYHIQWLFLPIISGCFHPHSVVIACHISYCLFLPYVW
jgi:hypothetical protein